MIARRVKRFGQDGKQVRLALVVGNRRGFPSRLCESGRDAVVSAIQGQGHEVVVLGAGDTEYGVVQGPADVERCAALLKANAERIDGIVVSLPNFGDERSVVDSIRSSGLRVPILVHAFPDSPTLMRLEERRDSFCGKTSVCCNLTQCGLPFSLTTLHTVDPASPSFQADLRWFAGVCRVAGGLRRARIGLIGGRPTPFKTMRCSEKLLERSGITVEVVDLLEIVSRAVKLQRDAGELRAARTAMEEYVALRGVSPEALDRMARMAAVIERWVEENALDATAVLCWRAIEEHFGIVPCGVMSRLTSTGTPSACEADVGGAVAMYALQLAAGTPSGLVDWNNNYGNDPDRCILYHCSALPRDILESPFMTYHERMSNAFGHERTCGNIEGRIKAGAFTYCRVTTDDTRGSIGAYVGEGEFTRDPLETYGAYGVARIENLQGLLRHMCARGFEHHVAISLAPVARAVHEAMSTYLGWESYFHR